MSNYPSGSPQQPHNPYAPDNTSPAYQQQYQVQPPQYTMPHQGPMGQPYQMPYVDQKNKVAAALLAFFLGGFGIHGFYLGNTAMGITLLVIYLISIPLMFLLIGFLGIFAVSIICLIQAILYITASDEEFYYKYVVQKRWF